MSDEQAELTHESAVDLFYSDDEAEPLEKPTVESSENETPVEVEVGEAAEAETEGEASEDENDDEESDILVYEINGKEYTAEQVEQLESGNMMQADYTKKTQELSKEREVIEQNTTLLSDAITKTNDLSAQLEVLVGEDAEINWAELKEDDPDEYIKLKERADNRKVTLDKVKANNSTTVNSSFDTEAEKVKLVEANPLWVEDGKATQAYTDDMELLTNYYADNKISQEEAQFISQNARVVQLVLDDARSKAESKTKEKKAASTKKKIIKAPSATKPKGNNSIAKSASDIMYG